MYNKTFISKAILLPPGAVSSSSILSSENVAASLLFPFLCETHNTRQQKRRQRREEGLERRGKGGNPFPF